MRKIKSLEWEGEQGEGARNPTSSAHSFVRANRELVPRRFASRFAVLNIQIYKIWYHRHSISFPI